MTCTRRWKRAARGAQAVLAVVLALGAALLAVDVADWRYLRVDLSSAGRNTLDPAVLDVVDRLPEPVVIDVFTRPLARPYDGVWRLAKQRVDELLGVLQNARRDRVEVRAHGPKDFEAAQQRQMELGTAGTNKLVLSCGARRAELELFGELCTIDWGNPREDGARYLTVDQGIPGVVDPRTWQRDPRFFRPAQFQEFHGEELLAQALLKVASGEAPRVYFAEGHGEPALDGTEPTDLARLRAALERDGFAVARWDPLRSPAVPDDCDVLALIGAAQPYQTATRAAILDYAGGGGRVLAAPHISELQEERAGGIADVLRDLGLALQPGIVCQPFVGLSGEPRDGDPQCSWLVIDEGGLQPGHPLTEPLRMRGRRVQFTLSPSFEDSAPDGSGVVLPIVTSPRDSWRDLLPYDYRFNPARGEARDRHTLVAVKQLRASKTAEARVQQGRVIGIASAFFFDNDVFDVNRDFALNAFNWLAEREYRIAVSPLPGGQSFLDFQRSSARPVLVYTLWLGLPGLCAAIGAAVFLRRRS